MPLATPGLAQQIRSAQWRFTLRPAPDPAALDPAASAPASLTPERWAAAVAALLEATSLPWQDQDKKGRPRERECRPYLLDLRLVPAGGTPPQDGQALDLEAAVDPQGRSLRPDHLRHWLSIGVGRPLVLGPVQRRCLRLDAC